MHSQHIAYASHTQRDRSRQLRQLVVARAQHAVLKDTGQEDITLGWSECVWQDDHWVSKFRKGKVTWPNVREASHEGKLFAKFAGDAGWYEVLGEGVSNDQLMEWL